MIATDGLVEVAGHRVAEVTHIHHAVIHVLVLHDLGIDRARGELLFAHLIARGERVSIDVALVHGIHVHKDDASDDERGRHLVEFTLEVSKDDTEADQDDQEAAPSVAAHQCATCCGNRGIHAGELMNLARYHQLLVLLG